jgi:hypothetical protein
MVVTIIAVVNVKTITRATKIFFIDGWSEYPQLLVEGPITSGSS